MSLNKHCSTGVITQTGFSLPVIDRSKCIQCGECVRKCGMAAIYTDAG